MKMNKYIIALKKLFSWKQPEPRDERIHDLFTIGYAWQAKLNKQLKR